MDKTQLLFDQFNELPIAFFPVYSKITGSVTAGLLLSQIIYWQKKMGREIYKTDDNFCQELCMELYELKGAKTKLQKLGLVNIVRKGVPAKTYYFVDFDKVIECITSYGKNPQLVMGKTHNKSGEKPITINTENTTEITTDIIKEKKEKKENSVDNFSFSEQMDKNIEPVHYSIECNQIMEYMKDCWELPKLDGHDYINLQYIQKCIKEYGMIMTHQAIECVPKDDFYKNICTSAKVLYNNMAKILKGSKLNLKNKTYASYTTN